MKSSFYKLLVFLALTACSNDDPIGNQSGESSDMPVFKASLEMNDSRAHLSSDLSVHWTGEDRISVFAKSSDHLQYVLADGANSTLATFHAVANGKPKVPVLPLYGAVYPFDGSNTVSTVDGGLAFSFSIPQVQSYAVESFDKKSFPMLAVSRNTSLQFRNVCGLIMLQLSGKRKIASIEVVGNNHEVLSGRYEGTLLENGNLSLKASVEGSSKSIPLSVDARPSDYSTSTVLTCSDNGGVQLKDSPSSFFISVAPVTFSEGFNVTLTDAEGRTKVLRGNSPQTIASNQLLKMPVVNCEFSRAQLKAGRDINWALPEHASICFRSSLNSIANPENYLQVSADGSESPAYLMKEGSMCSLSTTADDIILNADCSEMFKQGSNLKAISFAQCNTQYVENMNGMFKGCTYLTTLDMRDVSTRHLNTVAGLASMFEQVGADVPEGCDLVLGKDFIIGTPENAAGMFSKSNFKSITCTPELQQFIVAHAQILGLKAISAAGPISWFNLYTGQPMHTASELVITHDLSQFFVPQLEGAVMNARIWWGDNQEEAYNKEASHTYPSVGEHQVTLHCEDAEGVSFSSIKGIKKINFSKF